MVLMWLTAAFAQAPPVDVEVTEEEAAEDEAAEDEEELGEIEVPAAAQIVVYGERLVDQARREVVESIEELGYGYEVKEQGDRVVYRHPNAWYGEVHLHDDGWMQVKRQRLRVEGRAVPWAKKQNSVGAWLGCFVYPWACIRVYGATVSRRRWMGTQTRTVTELEPKVRILGDRIADLATTRRLAELPDRLEALWADGTPIEGTGPVVPTPEARREALLDYWASRTDTVWGRAMRESVENFVAAVVQESPHPFGRDEVAAFNRDREPPIVIPDPDPSVPPGVVDP